SGAISGATSAAVAVVVCSATAAVAITAAAAIWPRLAGAATRIRNAISSVSDRKHHCGGLPTSEDKSRNLRSAAGGFAAFRSLRCRERPLWRSATLDWDQLSDS